jgi:hypothetical protein
MFIKVVESVVSKIKEIKKTAKYLNKKTKKFIHQLI